MITDRIGKQLERVDEFDDGDQILEQGQPGTDMYVVLEGAVRISRRTPMGREDLATIRQGEFFGEMSVLESMPRDADAHAVGRVRLLVIGQGGLLVRLRRDPSLALEMLHQLSGRLRMANQRLPSADTGCS